MAGAHIGLKLAWILSMQFPNGRSEDRNVANAEVVAQDDAARRNRLAPVARWTVGNFPTTSVDRTFFEQFASVNGNRLPSTA